MDPDAPLTPGAMLFGLFALILLVVATGIVVGLALQEQNVSLPSPVDVVVYEILDSTACIEAQVTAISNNLTFRRNIYILTTEPSRVLGIADFVPNCFFVPVVAAGPSQREITEQMFANVSNLRSSDVIPHVADRFLFMGNTTVPFRNVSENSLFYGSRPRAFNVFRDVAEVATLVDYFTYTAPSLVGQFVFVGNNPLTSIEDFLLFSISQDLIVVRNDFMRDVFVNRNSDMLIANYEAQFSKLDSSPPLFATFHVTGTDIQQGFNALGAYLTNHFI